jgi:2-oxoisovalerate dehydrogenase E2 component (dihydrolipoyl transacylase)
VSFVEVKLSDIGEGMTEAVINCYFVKPGDFVKADQPLLEVQTDKMTAEIPAPAAGIIKEIKALAGETILVGTTLLILEKEANSIVDSASRNESNNHLSLPNDSSVGPTRIMASPFTRKIAREKSVPIEVLNGTGPGGRITDEDVYRYIEQNSKPVEKMEQIKQPTVHAESSNGGTIEPLQDKQPTVQTGNSNRGTIELQQDKQPTVHAESSNRGTIETLQDKQPTVHAESNNGGTIDLQQDIIPFRGKRKQIAKKMVHSLNTIAHCTHFEEIDVSQLLDFRSELKKINRNITATAFFLKALSICLKEFPIFNASLVEEDEAIQLKREHHIGVAVDTPDGLIVPVIKNVEKKSITIIHKEVKELTQKALQGQLILKDISGGTFTISNVGPLGGSIGATPIIQHPEVALVSCQKTKKRPVVIDDDQIVIRSIMNVSMSFDHRVADGATAVAFTNRLTELIENPKFMLLEMV